MWPFKRQNVSSLAAAIRGGQLIDMQRPPFQQFNQIFGNDFPILITKAAYQTCIHLPSDSRKPKIPPNARWGFFFLSFLQEFQTHTEDSLEGFFEVNVMSEDGFQRAKNVKIVDAMLEGEEGFVFMLPDETWPLAAKV